ncbi:nucleoside permease [Rhodocytophaga rosea]|uniref:Nucleoside permease n=1 Tax=Rhodocytophaga rosea TaxID=2704465 RepID=A0A6C0GQR2_9BACT|nr:nucleoside permease [Rhodocytophaga rosea]QHT69840.1 nucleoside permease [Rhodocytophaga rosea]
MNTGLRIQLSLMMFLQYFIWGSWYVTLGTYLLQTLKFTGEQNGLAYGAFAIAAIVAPFFVGMIADRFFATQKVLGILHIIGAGFMFLLTLINDFPTFYICLFVYTLCYTPTMALTNSICFRQLEKPGEQMPGIRVLGTVGWIAAGLFIDFLGVGTQATPMLIASVASLVLGFYCFSLPHTPPVKKEGPVTIREVLGLDALALMKNPSFAILVIASVLVCIPLSFYYSSANVFLVEAGVENVTSKMALGQASELIFMLLMPLFFVRLGVKKMMLLGMAAWIARYLLFAYGNNETAVWMFYGGILLHGICYDFFFLMGQIYVDNKAPVHLKSAAQGMITLATYGIGMLIGTWLSGKVVDAYSVTTNEVVSHQWQQIWMVPAFLSVGVLILFALFFREKEEKKKVSVQA